MQVCLYHVTYHIVGYYTPALKKWGVYWFTSVRGSVRPSVCPSVTHFCQRYLHNRIRQKLDILYTCLQWQVVSWDWERDLSYVYFPVFVPFSFSLHFFVKDISPMVWDRRIIFGIQNDNNKAYCGIENQPSPVCSSMYLLTFLSLHTFSNVFFRKRFLRNCSS